MVSDLMTSPSSFTSTKNRGRPRIYPRVLEQMTEMVNAPQMQPGAELESESKLCERFGASRPLIRRALGALAEQGKIVSYAGRGHFVASPVGQASVGRASRPSSIATTTESPSNSGTIVAALGSTISQFPAHYDYSMCVLQGLENIIASSNYRLLWEMIGPSKRGVGKMVKPYIPDLLGLAAIPLSDQSVKEYLASASEDAAKVVIGRPASEFNAPCVYVNHKKGMFQGMNYLLSLGHTRIGYIGGAEESYPIVQRWLGFCEALSGAGLDAKDMPAAHVLHGSIIGGNSEQVKQAANNLLDRASEMTALVVGSGSFLPWVLRAIEARGLRIPEDLSLLSFDDTQAARENLPGITAIRQPTQKLGELGGKILLGQLESRHRYSGQDTQEFVLDCELIVRNSCAKQRAATQSSGAGVPPAIPAQPEESAGRTNETYPPQQKVDAFEDSFIHPTNSLSNSSATSALELQTASPRRPLQFAHTNAPIGDSS